MKLYLVLYLAILKTISGISNITQSENISNATSHNISCYSCAQPIIFNNTDDLYNAKPDYLENNIFCTNKTSVKLQQIDTANSLCAISIVLAEDTRYKIQEKAKKMIIQFSARKKNDCLLSEALPTDAICLKSTCRLFSKCCDRNLCNNAEAFKLMALAVYSNPQDKNLKNSYSRYTNTKCDVSVKDKSIAKNQPCIVAAGNNISTTMKTIADTTKNNSEITRLKYSNFYYLILSYFIKVYTVNS